MNYLTPFVRKRLYEVGIAGIGVAVVYGVLSHDQAAAWTGVLAPLLGVARGNVDSFAVDDGV